MHACMHACTPANMCLHLGLSRVHALNASLHSYKVLLQGQKSSKTESGENSFLRAFAAVSTHLLALLFLLWLRANRTLE